MARGVSVRASASATQIGAGLSQSLQSANFGDGMIDPVRVEQIADKLMQLSQNAGLIASVDLINAVRAIKTNQSGLLCTRVAEYIQNQQSKLDDAKDALISASKFARNFAETLRSQKVKAQQQSQIKKRVIQGVTNARKTVSHSTGRILNGNVKTVNVEELK